MATASNTTNFSFISTSLPVIESQLSCNNQLFPSFFSKYASCACNFIRVSSKSYKLSCKLQENEVEENRTKNGTSRSSMHKMDDYNTAMKKMMRNPYEYHHDLGMNYTLITENLIVGSQPQKAEDINHLKEEMNVAYILNLQQDKDVEYWGIDLQSIIKRCEELGIRHMRRPARDFDPDSLRNGLPKAVSLLDEAISEGKGRAYVHCTAGLGRAPAVAIAYMFWFCDMNLSTAYDTLTSKRPCGPNRTAIRGATYDLAKDDPWKEPFETLPDHAFADVADWERKRIQDRVHALKNM
ncbi:protein phosphatase [Lithospermum erythrorhizon]|uniref:Protein phosphatase n=1 Tax=Lithospermum erythrorhizon TaxID=34254 RepID=A0AAV3NQI9_LITER